MLGAPGLDRPDMPGVSTECYSVKLQGPQSHPGLKRISSVGESAPKDCTANAYCYNTVAQRYPSHFRVHTRGVVTHSSHAPSTQYHQMPSKSQGNAQQVKRAPQRRKILCTGLFMICTCTPSKCMYLIRLLHLIWHHLTLLIVRFNSYSFYATF